MLIKQSLLATCVVAGMLSAACARTDRPYMDSAAGTVVIDSVRVVDLTIGKGVDSLGKIVQTTDNFMATDTVRASVKTTGTAPLTRITARWTMEDGTALGESEQTISPTGEALTEFHMMKAGGWAKGKYKVGIWLAGKEVETETFTIK